MWALCVRRPGPLREAAREEEDMKRSLFRGVVPMPGHAA